MPVEIVRGNLFESRADALVNPVNCVGVSGKGLAKAFARRFPFAQKTYEWSCRSGNFKIGSVLEVAGDPDGTAPFVLFFPTKDHWRNPSRREYIAEGLIQLREVIRTSRYKTVAVPALGCGLGGLSWEWVRPAIVEALASLDTKTMVYAPVE